ncbi:myosin heavy chain 95F-like [Sitodiplosis mosellana]|uniref:myosin heavy chain 95F-like n=1 Tax=Sitodiplosis mosellana TaxID=263140 RepID=UPI00244470A9|nr:myosin heavy chain 95F-like [Sitodiplosis mosellana]
MKTLDLFSRENMEAYQLKPRGSMPPHIYSIGTDAMNALHGNNKPQCIIVTGESGAGKTVITHHLTQFICNSNPNREYIMKRAATSAKLLAIFGNAETPENSNSSRFIKFLQIKYNSKNEVSSIYTSYQLLEISRLCGLTTFGSNFHVFYLLTVNAPISLKDSLGLIDQNFRVLAPKNANHLSPYNFDDLNHSLDEMDLSKAAKEMIYGILAAILHLCNLEFSDDSYEHAEILNVASLNFAARLLKLDSDELSEALTKQKLKTVAETSCITMPLNSCNAMRTRDSMVKSIYKSLFQFLIGKMNRTNSESVSSKYIAILDIAGFECQTMGQNCFEQICINYINETVQQFCIRKQIIEELEWYADDGIHIPDVNYLDNREILDLFEDKTNGIWSLLEDESKKRKPSNETFFQNLITKCSKNPAFTLPKISKETNKASFVIKHFSKNVCYSAENFVQKNTQFVSTTILDIISKSLKHFKDTDLLNHPNDSKSITLCLKNDLGKLMSQLDGNVIFCLE